MSPAAVPVWARVGDCERSGALPESGSLAPVQALASPKSRTLTLPSGVTLTFAGFRSRWTMPFSWASSRASAICLAMASASSTGIAPALQPLGEVLSLDELEDEEELPVRLLEPVDGGDARVVERREELRLAPEAGEALGVLRELGGEHLEGHLAPELRVGGAVHLAHPAGADRGGDPVVGERLADQWGAPPDPGEG